MIRKKDGKTYLVFEKEVPLTEAKRKWDRYNNELNNINRNIQGLQRRKVQVENAIAKLEPYVDEIQKLDKEKPSKQGG